MPDNEHGQPVGDFVVDWTPSRPPSSLPLTGAHVRIVPLDPERHGADLHRAFHSPEDPRTWTYMAFGPFPDAARFQAWLVDMGRSRDPLFHVWEVAGVACGLSSFLNIVPDHGTIELGNVTLGTSLRRTTAATEGFALMLREAFEVWGYRRFEWKCDAQNAPSIAAALRLGFTPEGVFRCHRVVRGRQRDTAWFSITVDDWPAVRAGLDAWLSADNHGPDGAQRTPLAACRPTGSLTSAG